MSNKAALYLGEVGLDLLQWAAAQTSSGGFVVPPDGAQINNPAPGNWLWGKIEKPAPNRTIVRVIVDTTGIEYVNHVINDAWFGWRQYATATQPQVYDLLLAEGFSAWGLCHYWKGQNGIVTLNVNISSTPATTSRNEAVIGNLPEGYRPTGNVIAAAYCNGAGYIFIDYLGVIRMRGDADWTLGHASVTFFAP